MNLRTYSAADTLMKRRQLLTAAAGALVATVQVPAHAQPGSEDEAGGSKHGIVGAWFAVVTATNPPLGQFNALTTFHEDGTTIDSRRYLAKPTPFGDLLETTAHGSWRESGHGSVQAVLRAFVQSVNTGFVIGVDNVRLSLTLGADGNSITGTFITQLKDAGDNVLFQFSGDYFATRIAN